MRANLQFIVQNASSVCIQIDDASKDMIRADTTESVTAHENSLNAKKSVHIIDSRVKDAVYKQ